tara:strand:- start:218 stop:355 length:138 start_codon:yes stop_codon:yes gene_type:complete
MAFFEIIIRERKSLNLLKISQKGKIFKDFIGQKLCIPTRRKKERW